MKCLNPFLRNTILTIVVLAVVFLSEARIIASKTVTWEDVQLLTSIQFMTELEDSIAVRGSGKFVRLTNEATIRCFESLLTEYITLDAFLNDGRAPIAMFAGTHRYANGDGDEDGKPDSDVVHDTENLVLPVTKGFSTY